MVAEFRRPLESCRQINLRSVETQKTTSFGWDSLFDHEISPLLHIPNFNARNMVLKFLG